MTLTYLSEQTQSNVLSMEQIDISYIKDLSWIHDGYQNHIFYTIVEKATWPSFSEKGMWDFAKILLRAKWAYEIYINMGRIWIRLSPRPGTSIYGRFYNATPGFQIGKCTVEKNETSTPHIWSALYNATLQFQICTPLIRNVHTLEFDSIIQWSADEKRLISAEGFSLLDKKYRNYPLGKYLYFCVMVMLHVPFHLRLWLLDHPFKLFFRCRFS